MASFSTIAVETLAGASTAALCGFPSSTADQLQKWAHTERGNSLGLCASIPAVVHDNTQDRPSIVVPARAGIMSMTLSDLLTNWRGLNCAPSFSRNSHWSHCPSPGVRTNCGVSPRALPRINSSRNRACKPFARNSLPRQQVQQAIADRRHLSVVLSKPSSSAGFKTSWKALTNDEILFDAGSTSHD